MFTTIKEFYWSKAWKDCRDQYRKKKKGLCERCLKKGIVKEGEQVHHKIRLSIDNINNPSVALNDDNLELLCRECHEKEHEADASERGKKRFQSKRRFFVDMNTGKVITRGK